MSLRNLIFTAATATLFALGVGTAQAPNGTQPVPGKVTLSVERADPADEFVCPMDPDVRSKEPGKCPRCGMKLVAGVPDFLEYRVSLKTHPLALKAGVPTELQMIITNPKDGKRVTDFEIMHERIFHFFLVSQDLSIFVHDHPVKGADSVFRLPYTFPKPGLYQILSDFYPKGGTPQLIAKTIIVPGAPFKAYAAKLKPDVGTQKGANLEVSLTTDPPTPIAGTKTLMFFKLSTARRV